ncbi:MAG: cation:dicarboxylase symporter family transporter [Bacteroidales bacterium]|nr:cation:dicarboxylase symporter family transporter [Bacteroidales bacterium]
MLKKISLSSKVLLGVVLGILLGFFFGEHVSWFSIIGDIFIGLLQMTVLPYIMFSLIVNIGRLSFETGKKLVKYGLIFLLMLLGIGLLWLAVLPLAFPEWGSGSFYSNDFITEAVPFSIVDLYIPANPFASLSNNIVPAVVLFSIFVGLGVMKLPNKEVLLRPLDVLNDGLNQVNKMIVKITPIGVFSIAAGVVSQLTLDDLSRLQGYLLVYLFAIVVITFIVLPYVISIFTPFSTRTIFKITHSTLITIFATGKIIVVFPQLIDDIKRILDSENVGTESAKAEVDVIMPLAYPFPNLGTFMIFIFVPFAAWYSGHELTLDSYPLFLSSTLLSSFVAPITGLPFSIDLLGIPQETFQLFVVSTVLTDRVRVVLGAFHLITLTLLTLSATQGILKFSLKKLISALIVISLIGTGGILGMNKVLEWNMSRIPTNLEILDSFKLISNEQPYTILKESKRNPKRKWRRENSLSRIKRTKTLRVGFYDNAMPYSYYNSDSLLVGLGIDISHKLAEDLGVSIVFVPIEKGELIKELKSDYFDIVVSDIFLSSNYAEQIQFSKPYLKVSLALVVKKENENFNSFENASNVDTFTIAYFERGDIAEEYISFFKGGGAYAMQDLNDFFDQSVLPDSIKIDAYLTSAERASALTILNDGYKVVNPLPVHLKNALVFPVAKSAVWNRYIDNWIDYRQQDGTIEKIYKQWILGQEYKKEKPIWNVWDNIIIPKYNSTKDTLQ